MEKLYSKLKGYNLELAKNIEISDRQYKALKKLEENFSNKELYLALIIGNSIICYQLSGTGEKYWEEFSDYFVGKDFEFNEIINQLSFFIKNSKNNKRFIDTKINRLKKLKNFFENFDGKGEYYYNNMLVLRDELALILGQKNTAKTIVFAVKMFSYGARNLFSEVMYPQEIFIPIDSRITAIFEKYKEGYNDIEEFYLELAKRMSMPLLLLDSVLWVNYKDLI